MTIPMDNAVSFTMGHVFAVSARDAIRDDPAGAARCLTRGRLFTAFVFVPLGAYFYARWPEWTCMYLNGERLPVPLIAALGYPMYLVSHELGYRNAARLIGRGRVDEAVLQGAASLSALALVSAWGWRRFRWQGTGEEYRTGSARDVLKSVDFLLSMALFGAVFGAAAAAVVMKNRREAPA
ncbi:MAG: hypothetical protein V1748_06175 [Actinomycetota bacterium]